MRFKLTGKQVKLLVERAIRLDRLYPWMRLFDYYSHQLQVDVDGVYFVVPDVQPERNGDSTSR